MSFSIELDPVLRSKMQAWNLSPRLIHEILDRLYEELAESPLTHLKLLPPPANRLQYSFIVRAIGDPPIDYLFSFSVLYHADEETLLIGDCEFVTEEAGP